MAKILLVEDDNNLREIYQARLTAEGYEIISAQNGEEALVMAKQNKPDLIISDVMMPRISGFEMLDILRNTDELKQTKIIMLTALGQAEDKGRADNLGADKYLVKSQVTLEDIINAAKELLGETPVTPPSLAATPQSAAAPAVAAAEPVATPVEPTPVSAAPSEAVTLQAVVPEPVAADPTATPVAQPGDSATAVPASVAPQPDTTVVVPPAPADPTPPAVTTTVVAPDEPVVTPSAPPVQPDGNASESAAVVTRPATSDTDTAIAPNTSEVADTAQSIDAEEAALQSQIDSFSQAPAVTPAEQPVETAVESADDAANDETIANAVQELNGESSAADPVQSEPAEPASATEPAETPHSEDESEPATDAVSSVRPTVITPTPTAENSTSDSDHVTVVGKKVIQPLNDLTAPGPNLDELLAKEDGTSATSAAAPEVDGQPAIPPVAPGQSNDPSSISL